MQNINCEQRVAQTVKINKFDDIGPTIDYRREDRKKLASYEVKLVSIDRS